MGSSIILKADFRFLPGKFVLVIIFINFELTPVPEKLQFKLGFFPIFFQKTILLLTLK